ncbi:MAG TPA: hypothetical protein VEI81_01950 [Methanoregula sp.]|nr:hypothetical protein [Methanoregula sp.]
MKRAYPCLALLAGLLIAVAGCTGTGTPAPVTPEATAVASPTMAPASATSLPTALPSPTPSPDPYPGALSLKDPFPFGNGSTAGVGTVYRVFINDSYSWHNDQDYRYYLQTAAKGSKYLFLFVDVYNAGDTRFWPPFASSVRLFYNGQEYFQDPDHFIPDLGVSRKEKPVEIAEVQYDNDLYGTEYTGDYGYSHGSELAYLYPGKSNAMDGYIIYVVPASLTPDQAYARIEFNGRDAGTWRLG